MSSAPQPAGRSQTPDEPRSDEALAALVRLRGAPLLEALERQFPGARERAEATGTFAFGAAVALGLGRAGAELSRETAKLQEVGRLYGEVDHHEAGARLALGAGIPENVCHWLLQIRERFDGRGPDGLRGDAIPIAARIARAASVCERQIDALESEWIAIGAEGRRNRAIAALHEGENAELDPGVVDALKGVLERASDAV